MNRPLFRLALLLFVSLASAATGCSRTPGDEASPSIAQSPAAAPNASAAPLTITSTAFAENGAIPPRFTCEGENVSPPLVWSNPPAGTKSLAVVVDDPDAPKQTFVHWVVYDLAASTRGLPEGTKAAPPGARNGKNDFGQTGYGGPCPPSGRHRYVFKVYALDVALPDLKEPSESDLDRAMNAHVLAQGQLVGTYEKGHKPQT